MRIVFAQAYNLMDMGFSISLSVASIKKKKKKKGGVYHSRNCKLPHGCLIFTISLYDLSNVLLIFYMFKQPT